MKFDVVVGNPPYQDGITGTQQLWKEFSFKSLEISDQVNFVTPTTVLNGGTFLSKNVFRLIKDSLLYLDYSTDNHFKVGQTICAWGYSKPFNGLTEITCENGEKELVDLSKFDYFPIKCKNKIELHLFQKTYNCKKINWVEYKNKEKPNSAAVILPKSTHLNTASIKFSTNASQDSLITSTQTYCLTINQSELNSAKSYFESKFFEVLFKMLVSNSIGNTKKLPIVQFDKIWTTKEIYRHFNLTDEEFDYVFS